jgi:hypothetical protein
MSHLVVPVVLAVKHQPKGQVDWLAAIGLAVCLLGVLAITLYLQAHQHRERQAELTRGRENDRRQRNDD